MAMQGSQSVATDETQTLIASDKVEGTTKAIVRGVAVTADAR